MASVRGEFAGARVAAAAQRRAQLSERIARLRAGESSTHADVVSAQLSAAHQREEALRAQERLVLACASAAELAGGRTTGRRSGPDTPPPDTARDPGPQGSEPGAENRILRHALISIASSGEVQGGWSKDRRQQLWWALTEQCSERSWRGWSRTLCRTAVTLLPGLRGAALSAYDGHGVPHVLAVSDEWARQAEEVAQMVGEGPALEAYRTQVPVLVTDLVDEQARWPGYVGTAAGLGLRTLCALPVQLDGVGLGSLTLYPSSQDGSGWPGWSDGLFLAAVAAKTLLADLDAMDDGWPLGDVGEDRVSIATGVLAVRLEVSVEEASARLRAAAFSSGRGLGQVADAVLDGSFGPT